MIDPSSSVSPAVLGAFGREGFVADKSAVMKKGIWMAKANPYDLVLFFIPSISVLAEAARKIYAVRPDTYLVALTGPLSASRRIDLLEGGLDEIVYYPCTFRELTARIRSLLRRIKGTGEPLCSQKIDDLTIDPVNFRVVRGERDILLRRKEFDLLLYLFRNSGRVVTKTNLLEGVWDANADLLTNTLEVHILNLRKKIDSGYSPERKLIHTVYGRGYLFGLRPSALTVAPTCVSPRRATAAALSK